MSRSNSWHSLPTYLGPKQESHRAGEFILLAFSSAEVIGSDQWGKQKLLSSFPTPQEGCSLYTMWLQFPNWCIYFTAIALSAQSRVTQQKVVYKERYLPRKPKTEITGCRYTQRCIRYHWQCLFIADSSCHNKGSLEPSQSLISKFILLFSIYKVKKTSTIDRWLGNCIILLLSSLLPINLVAKAGHQMQDAANRANCGSCLKILWSVAILWGLPVWVGWIVPVAYKLLL